MTALDLAAVRYPEDDDRPHEPGGGSDWQESYVFAWWDDAAGIGGFFRTGHETGRNAASALVGLVTKDGLRYRRNLEDLPLTAGDRKDDTFGAAGGAYAVHFGDGTRRFEIHDGDCDLALDVGDFYPMYNYYAVTSGQVVGRQVGSDHYQVAGRVTGTVRLAGRDFAVDGLCHRDHSWGDRQWSAVLAHRWLAGTFGPELSFSLVTTLLPGGRMVRMGFVARHSEILRVSDSDVAVFLEPDGTSHRGGYGTGLLPDGEAPPPRRRGHRRDPHHHPQPGGGGRHRPGHLRRPRRVLRPGEVEQPPTGNGSAAVLPAGGQCGRGEPTRLLGGGR